MYCQKTVLPKQYCQLTPRYGLGVVLHEDVRSAVQFKHAVGIIHPSCNKHTTIAAAAAAAAAAATSAGQLCVAL
jgi:hypothetical protein